MEFSATTLMIMISKFKSFKISKTTVQKNPDENLYELTERLEEMVPQLLPKSYMEQL